jgi:lipoprotein-anchoring transpeptidase ErfK/SrfK
MNTNHPTIRTAAAVLGAAIAMTSAAYAADMSSDPRRIVISLADRKLAIVERGEVVRVFSVAVGADVSPSPVGTFTIVTRIPNPTYYKPGRVIGPGAANPLGTRWIGLSEKGYGIHGTDQPRSIGFAKSHGCIRLRNQDVERLFELVRVGDIVELHAERTPDIEWMFADNQ